MRSILFTAFVVALFVGIPPAYACSPTTSTPLLTTCGATGGASGCVYVAHDVCPIGGCIVSLWVYRESNGISGLQRSDTFRDDTCHGFIPADTRIV